METTTENRTREIAELEDYRDRLAAAAARHENPHDAIDLTDELAEIDARLADLKATPEDRVRAHRLFPNLVEALRAEWHGAPDAGVDEIRDVIADQTGTYVDVPITLASLRLEALDPEPVGAEVALELEALPDAPACWWCEGSGRRDDGRACPACYGAGTLHDPHGDARAPVGDELNA